MWWLDDEVYDKMKNPECEKMTEILEKCKELNIVNNMRCNTISNLFKDLCKRDINPKEKINEEN
jgi:hypothetical protein